MTLDRPVVARVGDQFGDQSEVAIAEEVRRLQGAVAVALSAAVSAVTELEVLARLVTEGHRFTL